VSPLTFAVVSSSERTQEALGVFCRQLETSTGLGVAPCVVPSYEALAGGVVAGEIDLAWAPPLVAIELEDRESAAPLVVIKRSLRAGYHSALFARADAPYRRVEDLVGLTAAWVSRDSASGYFVPRWHLRSLGVDLDRAFLREIFCATHEAVTEAVMSGSANVGATHVGLEPITGQLAASPWLSMGAAASSVRVLLLIGPIPGDLIVVNVRVAAAQRRQLTGALLSVRADEDDAARGLFQASCFEPVPEGHLSLLRRLSQYAEARA
jgi:phosphate/phosphite/phosphonate ABC transporter binding protein